jgi:hypothetical protein
MTLDADGYGARPNQSDVERLLEDSRTLGGSGIERVAGAWARRAAPGWSDAVPDHHDDSSGRHGAWTEAERAALAVLERTNRVREWDDLRNRILDLTERHAALVAWRDEHGEVGHRAEDALLGAALALTARPDLDVGHERVLLGPMSAALPWLAESRSGQPR